MPDLTLSVIIPTYNREKILVQTVENLLDISYSTKGFIELILVDQTPQHEKEAQQRLNQWRDKGAIKWLRMDQPHLTRSMNLGLLEARSDIVLFTDDDIIPESNLLCEHIEAYRGKTDIWAVVGQILQPGEKKEYIPYNPTGGRLGRFLNFPFNRTEFSYVENAMAGNFSVKRDKALALGGFDENFPPPVAYRFETEFAKRIISAGGKILFEPKASVKHLQAREGGTRSEGSHLKSISPCHGVGDYYYALKQGKNPEKYWYIIKRPFRQIRTKFHFKNPWWIPIKFIGEIRAIFYAIKIYHQGPQYLQSIDYYHNYLRSDY